MSVGAQSGDGGPLQPFSASSTSIVEDVDFAVSGFLVDPATSVSTASNATFSGVFAADTALSTGVAGDPGFQSGLVVAESVSTNTVNDIVLSGASVMAVEASQSSSSVFAPFVANRGFLAPTASSVNSALTPLIAVSGIDVDAALSINSAIDAVYSLASSQFEENYPVDGPGVTTRNVAILFNGSLNRTLADFQSVGGSANEWLQWEFTVPSAGSYRLDFEYIFGNVNRPTDLIVNGSTITTIDWPSTTSDWADPAGIDTLSRTATLVSGTNTVRLQEEASRSGPNFFSLTVVEL